MIPIRIATHRRFRYLWLKSVHGFNPSVHCARCLQGEYHPGLSSEGARDGDVFEFDVDVDSAPFWYLCGVTDKWENNIHVPFRALRDAAPIERSGHRIEIEFPAGGVEILPIGPVVAGVDPAFGTCRNWIFGRQYFPDQSVKLASQAELASLPR
jgi:hypothetical protein